jgi:hypothetical protein
MRERRAAGKAVLALLAAIASAGLTGCAAGPVTVNHRILLTYVNQGASADALNNGVLGTNEHGCITVGEAVLVVPTGSRLNDDGSIDIGAEHYEQGETVSLGGGGGDPPAHSPCGSGDYWWV